MLKCPICNDTLSKDGPDGWLCDCGEVIPFGYEISTEENCNECPVMQCPKRKVT